MRILPVTQRQNIAFKRRLTNDEERELRTLNAQAKEVLGNTGNSVLIVHDACLPQAPARNTGVANILGQDSEEFFDFAKTYFGVNTIEVLPQGEAGRVHKNGLVCAYGNSALGLNDSLINPEILTEAKWRHIMLPEEFEAIVAANNAVDKATTVQYDKINGQNSVFQKQLRNSFDRFMVLDKNDDLRIEFEKYKAENADWLEPKVVYDVIKRQNGGREFDRWDSSLDKNLYNPRYPETQRNERINDVLSSNKRDAEFFRFKQFVAEKHLQLGREKLNKQGLKLFGDMPIGFAREEIWANPEAFLQDCHVASNDWKAPCLNYPTLTDENSAASRLLKRKAALNARRYDGIRFDASWLYIMPKMVDNNSQTIRRLYFGGDVLKMMEDEIRRVQGDKFSMQNLIHEFKASRDDFSIFNQGDIMPEVASRVTIFESENLGHSWGNNDYYSKTLGLAGDSYILGVGDHTAQPLRQIAEGMPDLVAHSIGLVRKEEQIPVLAHIFNDTVENLSHPAEFIRSKFADTMSAKHNFVFFMDALGNMSRFDSQRLNRRENYAFKVPSDFKTKFHQALQKGHALNLPDILARAFEKEGLCEQHAELYKKLCKFAAILREKDVANVSENVKKTSKGGGWKTAGIIGLSLVALVALGMAFGKRSKQSDSE
ncbi:MAG: 4-alpha-glucanotransferase [Fusobacterium sp.]|nr:4-alpha-glucanotransferase [Fusobacterium sp.]